MNQNISIAERTKALAIRIVKACTFLDEKPGVCRTLSKQLLRSGTAIGANVREAQSAQSDKDFLSKLEIALKEERETSLNPHLVEAMMGFPQGWTDVSLPTPDLPLGCVLPQSPASVGSVVLKLQRFRQIARENIANSGQNTKPLEDNTNNS